jgi:zinc transport system ATP-binding protein
VTHHPVIEMCGVSIGYDDVAAVREVDLRIDRGEVVALVGPNGSGKTTLVRGVLGLARVLEGEVRLFGVPAAQFGQRYRVGYVPQRHTVAGGVPSTVAEVVASGRLPRRRWLARSNRADRDAVTQALAAVGLTERRQDSVAALSGGQQRRCLIARALAGEPEVMIMDEPTAGVDPEAQSHLVATLAGLVTRGLTLLVVTHEVTPLARILSRVVSLDAGRVVTDAPVPAGLAAGDHDPGHDLDHAAPTTRPGWLGTPGVGG